MTATADWPSRWALAGIWIAAAAGFGLLLAVTAARGPLDDPDPARQRPGFLDGDGLPVPAPNVGVAVPEPGRRAVVFFVRPEQIAALCQALPTSGLSAKASLAVVVPSPSACRAPVDLVVDTGGLARNFGMPAPRDGGPPVGYAVIDALGRLRYRTLDPHVARGLDEVATILAAA